MHVKVLTEMHSISSQVSNYRDSDGCKEYCDDRKLDQFVYGLNWLLAVDLLRETCVSSGYGGKPISCILKECRPIFSYCSRPLSCRCFKSVLTVKEGGRGLLLAMIMAGMVNST